MNTRKEAALPDPSVTDLAKRARLDDLLFQKAKPGPGLAAIKWPDALGE